MKVCRRLGIEQGGHVRTAAPFNLVTQVMLGSAGVWEHWAGLRGMTQLQETSRKGRARHTVGLQLVSSHRAKIDMAQCSLHRVLQQWSRPGDLL